MALQVSNLKRTFSYRQNGRDVNLPDPNPNLTPAEVAKFYAMSHPELTTASVDGPKVAGDSATYEFRTTVGTKG